MISAVQLPPSRTDAFKQHFDVSIATSDEMLDRSFSLRSRVFCEEFGFLPLQGGQERDDHDDHSVHCLIEHRPSATDAGCVRLILPGERGGSLPFEKYGARHIDRKLFNWHQLDPTRCCEISRLTVLDRFRHPLRGPEVPGAPPTRTRDLPSVVQALYHATIALVLDRQFEWSFMIGEPRLARHLNMFGIQMRQVSPVFEYFGERAVFVASREDFQNAVGNWSGRRRELYDFVAESLTGTPASHSPVVQLHRA